MTMLAPIGITGCAAPEAEAPRGVIRLAIGPPGGGMYPLGQTLAAQYRLSIANTDFTVEGSSGTFANAEAVERGTADIGFVWADVAYFGYAGHSELVEHRFGALRGIAVLELTPVHLVVRPGRGIRTVADLKGRKVGIGPLGSGTSVSAKLVFLAFRLNLDEIQTETLAFTDGARRLSDGSLDAMFVDGIYPAESVSDATRGGGQLLPLIGPEIDALRHEYPFLRPITIPAGTYPRVLEPIHTIGVDLLLVCRNTLEESLVYTLTRHFFDALPSLTSIQSGLRFMDVEQASATPIPLHAGAARYYRERELRR
jgi:uncharacterized protein